MAISLGTGAARATLFTSTAQTTQYESNSINPDTDSESLVVALISLMKNVTSNVTSFNSVTFGTASRTYGTGTAMTVEVISDDTSNRPNAIFAWLKTDATGTVQVDSTNSLRGAIIDVIQLKSVDQTDPVPTNAAVRSTSTTGNNISLTTANDNSWLLAISNSKGNDSGPPNSSNGTNLHQGSTGASQFSDCKDAASYRAIASAGAETANFTWGDSSQNAQAAIEVKEAASGVTITLDAGSYTKTGLDLAITRQIPIALDTNPFAFTGLDLALTRQIPIALDLGTISFTGLDIIITRQIPIALDLGSFAQTGLDFTITRQIPIALDLAALTLTGNDLTITEGAVISLDLGTYTYSGLDLAITRALLLNLDAGNYTLAGNDLTITFNVDIPLAAGSLSFSGLDLTITFNVDVLLAAGGLTLTGNNLDVFRHLLVLLDLGALVQTGLDLAVPRQIPITLDAGAYTATGLDITITEGTVIDLAAGGFTLTGFDITIDEVSLFTAGNPFVFTARARSTGFVTRTRETDFTARDRGKDWKTDGR